MGMDLVAVIDHKMDAKEVLSIPKLLAKSSSLLELYRNQHLDSTIEQINWRGPYEMTEENILKIWETSEKGEVLEAEGLNFYAEIDTFFGKITVHKNTIIVSPWPEHKYGNLRTPSLMKYILTLNRNIANLFDSKKVLYCVDSYCEPEILYEKSMLGWSLDSIIEFGNEKFGIPPKEINEAIENLYFIDEFDLNLDEFDPKKKVWSRYQHEYEEENK